MWGQLLLLAAVQPVPTAPAADAGQPVPKSYLDCAARFREELRQTSDARFACTRAFARAEPGYRGATIEMDEARDAALDAADLYLEQVLIPETERALRVTMDGQGNEQSDRGSAVAALSDAADRYANASCGIVDAAFGPGSGRNVAVADCRIRHRDDLIGDLIRIQAGYE